MDVDSFSQMYSVLRHTDSVAAIFDPSLAIVQQRMNDYVFGLGNPKSPGCKIEKKISDIITRDFNVVVFCSLTQRKGRAKAAGEQGDITWAELQSGGTGGAVWRRHFSYDTRTLFSSVVRKQNAVCLSQCCVVE